MKVTDLMIGDWCAYGVNCKGRVTALTDNLITLSVDGDEINGLYILMPDMVNPIPLTDEILTKNGWFALDEYRYEGDVALAKESSGFRLKNTNICVNYVHQLQHLLRLSGIEKEIEL